jgi:hypothetical protein
MNQSGNLFTSMMVFLSVIFIAVIVTYQQRLRSRLSLTEKVQKNNKINRDEF